MRRVSGTSEKDLAKNASTSLGESGENISQYRRTSKPPRRGKDENRKIIYSGQKWCYNNARRNHLADKHTILTIDDMGKTSSHHQGEGRVKWHIGVIEDGA